MIVSFANRDTERLASGQRVRRFASFEVIARRKLRQLDIAGRLDDLKIPPGNINDKWWVCFRWTPAGPADVEIVDYHGKED